MGRHGQEPHYSDTDDSANIHSDTVVLGREAGYHEPATGPATGPAAERWRLGWNSGADLGLLLMRLVVGGIFAAHGAQKVLGWWGGPNLGDFANNLSGLGYRQSDVVAALTGFTELIGGILVLLGLFTPLAAAGLLAIAVNAIWIKWGNGLFLADGGFEHELALAGLAAGLTLTGPGRIALDNRRVWFRHPVITGWIFLLAGLGAGIAARLLLHG